MEATFHLILFNPFLDFKHRNSKKFKTSKKKNQTVFMVSTFIMLKDWELQEYFIQGMSRTHTPQTVIPSSAEPQILMCLWRLYQNIRFRLRADKKRLMTETISIKTDTLALPWLLWCHTYIHGYTLTICISSFGTCLFVSERKIFTL